MGVGMPAHLWLQEFGSFVWAAFGSPPYHVGSSLVNKDGWRDVDVRMMLTREEWDAWGFGDPKRPHDSEKWQAVCLAFSALGKQMTGLPIDFQVQEVETANEENPKAARSALGITPRRHANPKDVERRSNMLAIHDLASARLLPANAPADVHTLGDLREIERLSREEP